MTFFLQDFVYALRRWVKNPGFPIAAILTLTLGFGASSAILTLTGSVLFSALPYPAADRLVIMRGAKPPRPPSEGVLSYLDLQDVDANLGAGGQVFDAVAMFSDAESYNLAVGGEVEHVIGELVSASYFQILGVPIPLGRAFTAEEDTPPDAPLLAVIGHGLWQRRFGAERDVIGRTLELNERTYTIVGVAGPGFRGLTDQAEVWLPVATARETLASYYTEMRRLRWLQGVARLARDTSLEQAESAFGPLVRGLEAEHGKIYDGFVFTLQPLREAWFGRFQKPLGALLGAAAFVLLIACTNVANLLLAQGAARRHEMVVRSALGASRFRLVRQLLAETLLLALAGSLLALLLAQASARFLARASAIELRSFLDIGVSGPVIATILATAFLVTLLVGLLPALAASRRDLITEIHGGAGRTTGSRGQRRFQNGLIVAETALAIALLVGAGLMIRGFQRFLDAELGFNPRGLLTMRVSLTGETYASNRTFWPFARQLLERVAAIPGVEAVALEGPSIPTGEKQSAGFTVEDRLQSDPDHASVNLVRHHVSPDYFRALGIPLVAGRPFTLEDGPPPPEMPIEEARQLALSLIVSRQMAAKTWPGEDAVGKRIKPGPADSPAPWFEVIGVVDDVRHAGLGEDGLGEDADVYMTIFQSPPRNPPLLALLVRSSLDTASLVPSLRQAMKDVAPGLPLFEVETMADRLRAQAAPGRFLIFLVGIFATTALLLAAIGVYGVVAAAVSERHREIGIRMALGADRQQVLGLMMRRALGWLALGALCGLLGTLLLHRFLSAFLYGIDRLDPIAYGAAALLLMIAAAIAAYLPARRAASIAPATTLRAD